MDGDTKIILNYLAFFIAFLFSLVSESGISYLIMFVAAVYSLIIDE